ncbi:Cysteine-rich receptor-like protein kinase, partial [Corchorus olitorius]
AWKLWQEENILDLVDKEVCDSRNGEEEKEILRCIHVGLLCVQELAKDRPTISTVVSMLNSEIMDLPTPKQPAFTGTQDADEQDRLSVNYVTVSTAFDGR